MIRTTFINNTINPYVPSATKPWNARRIAHLYERLGFGASYSEIDAALLLSPVALVDQLIDAAMALPAPIPPTWADWTGADYDLVDDTIYFDHQSEMRRRWTSELLNEGIRAKMAFFWSNHFVTQEQVYGCPPYMWEYYRKLHLYAFGNFRTFVEAIGKDPAMLVFLNGNQNIASEPNENYARELMELFTMGEGNGYTQTDVVEVARALTGWSVDMYNCDKTVSFSAGDFDATNKTIFGETDNWDYDDVHQLIFTRRAQETAEYICTKLYKYFIYDTPDTTIVAALAATFQSNNWEIAPVLKQLFKSEHFFEDKFIGANIKSPYECLLGLLKKSAFTHPVDVSDDLIGDIVYNTYQLGQEIFNPVNVAGWPGYHAWINENTLTNRWAMSSNLFSGLPETTRNKYAQLARDLTDTSNDPVVVTQAIVDHFLQFDLEAAQFDAAVAFFKAGIPENYFDQGLWNLYYNEASDQVINLLNYLIRLPEYQLS